MKKKVKCGEKESTRVVVVRNKKHRSPSRVLAEGEKWPSALHDFSVGSVRAIEKKDIWGPELQRWLSR